MIRSEIKSLILQTQPFRCIRRKLSTFSTRSSSGGLFCAYRLKKTKDSTGSTQEGEFRLPAVGHVELNEHPKDTVSREMSKELGIEANFLMVTQTREEQDPQRMPPYGIFYKAM